MSEETEEKVIKIADWTHEKTKISLDFFNYKSDMQGWKFNTGEIYFCELGENIGNEINKKRPVLIISSTKYNKKQSTVIVAPLTSRIKYKYKNGKRDGFKFPFDYVLKQDYFPFLKKDSTVKLDQLRTVSKNRLSAKRLGEVDDETMRKIYERLNKIIDF